LINNVVLWERRLEIENERRNNHPFDTYRTLTADPQPRALKCMKVLEWRSKLNKDYQPVFCGIAQDCVYANQS
jgi:hypothetical protein